MQPSGRAIFVAAYSHLVADVWSDPVAERRLASGPRALLLDHGLVVPDEVTVTILRHASEEPDLDAQVRAWESMTETGALVLVVPSTEPISTADLDEDELDLVVGGLSASCSCCCPCCCSG